MNWVCVPFTNYLYERIDFKVNKVKIVVMVPSENTSEIRDTVCKAGAGIIGEYKFCSSCVKSLGTFIPGDNTNPYIWEKNKLEFVEEDRLEFTCDIKKAKYVISELRRVHPYEEPGIDIIPLIDEKDLL